jgi:hypothetical protein
MKFLTIYLFFATLSLGGQDNNVLHDDAYIEQVARKYGVKSITTSGSLLDISKKNGMDLGWLEGKKLNAILSDLGLDQKKMVRIEGGSMQAVDLARFKVSKKYELITFSVSYGGIRSDLVIPKSVFFAPHNDQKYGLHFFNGPTDWGKIEVPKS